MALRHCTECGGFLSTKSDHCPHCGHKNGHAFFGPLFVTIVVLCALGLGWRMYDQPSFDHAYKRDNVGLVGAVQELAHKIETNVGGK